MTIYSFFAYILGKFGTCFRAPQGRPGPPPIDMVAFWLASSILFNWASINKVQFFNQQTYSFEDTSFSAQFQTSASPDERLAPLSRLLCRRLWCAVYHPLNRVLGSWNASLATRAINIK